MDSLRYLSEADVAAACPPWAELIDLAAAALRAVATGTAQLPPKPKVFQRSHAGAFTNAMPAYTPEGDLLGIKWVAVEPRNEERDLPVINGLMVMNDAETGEPRCVMGARWLTGVRTAAITGACVRALAPATGGVALVGTGLQARTHLPVLAALGHRRVRVWGRRPSSIEALRAWAAEHAPDVELAVAPTIHEACADAGIVITCVTQGQTETRVDAAWLRHDALLLPIDYGTCIHGALAEQRLLLADDPRQFVAVRDLGVNLDGYRDPDGASGSYLDGPRPEGGIVVQNLGNGVSDLYVADAIIRRAAAEGLGTLLPL